MGLVVDRRYYLLSFVFYLVFCLLFYFLGFLNVLGLALLSAVALAFFALGVFWLREPGAMPFRALWERVDPIYFAYIILFLVLVYAGVVRGSWWLKYPAAELTLFIASLATAYLILSRSKTKEEK